MSQPPNQTRRTRTFPFLPIIALSLFLRAPQRLLDLVLPLPRLALLPPLILPPDPLLLLPPILLNPNPLALHAALEPHRPPLRPAAQFERVFRAAEGVDEEGGGVGAGRVDGDQDAVREDPRWGGGLGLAEFLEFFDGVSAGRSSVRKADVFALHILGGCLQEELDQDERCRIYISRSS
jgi:hypothetical protein